MRRAADAAVSLEGLAADAPPDVRERIDPVVRRAQEGFVNSSDREALEREAMQLADWLRERGGHDYRIGRTSLRPGEETDPEQIVGNSGAHLDRATAGQRALVSLQTLVGETQNGGYDQFLANCGHLVAAATAAADLVGWQKLGAALRRGDADEIEGLVDSENPRILMLRYVHDHPEEFFLPES